MPPLSGGILFVQSQVPELAELAFYYLNLVTVARLERNPTVKEEIRQRGFERDIPAGFLTYPVSQAADITAFKATLVPVGEDQVPMIEQTNEIVRRFNRIVGRDVLVEAAALVPPVGRLPGIDGKSKMSKSFGNVISLNSTPDEIRAAVRKIYTDPRHLRVEDPGHLDGNVAFTYLDAFDPDADGLAELKARYVQGGVADSTVKAKLEAILQELLAPMRARRQTLEKDPGYVIDLLRHGTAQARDVAARTMDEVKVALGLRYFDGDGRGIAIAAPALLSGGVNAQRSPCQSGRAFKFDMRAALFRVPNERDATPVPVSENGQTRVAHGATVRPMELDAHDCYAAIRARDARFDGCFFVGVSTTGIYCRPICPARTPARERCRFFASAAAAEQAGFRPCLRCRPELAPGVAPGVAPVDSVRTAARWLAARIEAGALNGADLERLAAEYGLSSRQMRRALLAEYGVTPIELAQTRRLLLAKQLLTDTALPMARVAHASGFASVRRFNAAFQTRYRLNPTALRRQSAAPRSTAAFSENGAGAAIATGETLTLRLSYRPPLAWEPLVSFLVSRGALGVDAHAAGPTGTRYLRTVQLDGPVGPCHGWFSVEPLARQNALRVCVAMSLLPVLTTLLARVRGMFDLDANPHVIDAQLGADAQLRALVRRRPGLRVPGAFDGFELALRAVLGQQVTVKAATTLFGRFAAAFGARVQTPFDALYLCGPSAERIADAGTAQLAKVGLPRQRAETLARLAREAAEGRLQLDRGIDIDATLARLQELPGIGPWTAHYIAMRALGFSDAFPPGDLGLLRALGLADLKHLAARAEAWRPWRAYAAIHLWTQRQAGG